MNIRQEVAAWIFGLLLAGISAYQGQIENEWIFELFVPGIILAVLAVFSLRTRRDASRDTERTLTVGAALVVVVAGLGHLGTRLRSIESNPEYNLKLEIQSATEEVKSELEALERKVDDLRR